MDNKIKLSKEKRDDMISSIKTYFYEEKDEELGDLAASLMLDFIIDKLSNEFYNQGVFDSYRYINERAEEMLVLQKY